MDVRARDAVAKWLALAFSLVTLVVVLIIAVRFQIGGLFGYIAAFLGASLFNIAEGIPLLPLQTLWVSFTMLSIQSVGLGYSKPAAGLI